MDLVSANHLVLLWWNTGLAPPVPKIKATADDREFVAAQIKAMRQAFDFGIFGLCEVQTSDLDEIMQGLGDPNLRTVDRSDRSGKRKFDIALIYDETKVRLVDTLALVEQFGKRKFKLGDKMTFMTVNNEIVFDVVLSHWPSRRTIAEKDPMRAKLAGLLVDSLKELRKDPNALLVLMGDYNDDPFSPSLHENLLATRDRELARKNANFLYNPFWRLLGGPRSSSLHPTDDHSVCGTHYYNGGDYSEWFMFDQMIFTSSFLNHPKIYLDENLTQIVSSPQLKERLSNRKTVCDHFPVISTIKLKMRASS